MPASSVELIKNLIPKKDLRQLDGGSISGTS